MVETPNLAPIKQFEDGFLVFPSRYILQQVSWTDIKGRSLPRC